MEASLRRSISKNTLDDDVLRTSTLRQSNVEKEVFSPVDKADDEDATKLRTTINHRDADNMSILRASKVIAGVDMPDDQAAIGTDRESETEVSDVELLAREYSPVYLIKCLPPYEAVQRADDPLLLPPLESGSKPFTLVLDLDETLVHSSLEYMENCHYCYHIIVDGVKYTVFARIRPYANQFLEYCSQFCEIVIFTASRQEYADRMLDFLDPEKKLIKHRLFRESCTKIGKAYVKDLNRLGRDLRRTVIIDNSIVSFGYHLDNGIPICSWFDNWKDQELYIAARIMYSLQAVQDVRPHIINMFRLRETIDCFQFE